MIGEKSMMNWTEEDVEFVVKSIIMPCFEEYINQDLKFKDMYHDSYERLFKFMSSEITKCAYETSKNRSFFLAFLGQMHGIPLEKMRESYDKYCEEYDKLNKHLLDDKKDDVNEKN